MEALFSKSSLLDATVKTNPIRSFSYDQILKATNGFDPSRYVTSDLYYTWFTGSIDDRSYMIKMFPEEIVKGDGDGIGAVYNDIVISARVTSHSKFPEVAQKVAGDISRMSRNASVIQRKGYTSDEELEELDSPLTFVIDKVLVSPISIQIGKVKQQDEPIGVVVTNVRYELLREVWSM